MLTFLEHPILKPPSDEEILVMTPEELAEYHEQYHKAIEASENDPLQYGFVLPNWRRAKAMLDGGEVELFGGGTVEWDEKLEVWVFGGNRSAKSAFSAYMVVNALVKNPGALITCWSQNQEASILNQQPYIYQYLPPDLRKKQSDDVAKINFKRATGFTENKLILPNGSQCLFKFYTQYEQDSSIIEGMELGASAPRDGSGHKWTNIGNWFDEYLGGPELLETMRLRLATRNAKNIVSFTPIDGFTETIRQVLDKSKNVETREAELLDGEQVPFLVQPANPIRSVIHFHSIDNPFGGYDRIKQELHGEGREKILTRAYGVAVKSATSKFPLFSHDVNVLDRETMAKRLAHKRIRGEMVDPMTHYMVIDPAGKKNWFMVWIAVDVTGTWYVYREWPGVDIGDWAEWKGGKWKPGLGAKGLGYGIERYVEEILTLEGNELDADGFVVIEGQPIEERIIDPRLGAASYQTMKGETSIIQQLEEAGMVTLPAPGLHEEDGLQALSDLMFYDNKRDIDGANRPHFYISEECENTIAAIGEYTGEGGKDEPWKDPIDCLRYAAISAIEHRSNELEQPFTGASGY